MSDGVAFQGYSGGGDCRGGSSLNLTDLNGKSDCIACLKTNQNPDVKIHA
jgi:hypothetical protein